MTIDTTDYLAVKERQIFDAIMDIAFCIDEAQNNSVKISKEDVGKMNVRLKALCKLYDKIRPDKKQIDLEFEGKSPYEALKAQFEKMSFEKMSMDDGK